MPSLTDLKNWLINNPALNPAGTAAGVVGGVQSTVTNEINSLTGNYTPAQLAAQRALAGSGPTTQVPKVTGLNTWLVGFGGLVVVLLLLSEGKHTSEFGAALGVVIAGTVALKDGPRVLAEVDRLFGTSLAPAEQS